MPASQVRRISEILLPAGPGRRSLDLDGDRAVQIARRAVSRGMPRSCAASAPRAGRSRISPGGTPMNSTSYLLSHSSNDLPITVSDPSRAAFDPSRYRISSGIGVAGFTIFLQPHIISEQSFQYNRHRLGIPAPQVQRRENGREKRDLFRRSEPRRPAGIRTAP